MFSSKYMERQNYLTILNQQNSKKKKFGKGLQKFMFTLKYVLTYRQLEEYSANLNARK